MKAVQENLATRIGVANANFFTNQLAVGGDLDMRSGPLCVEQAVDLVNAGITHVLDVRIEWDDGSIWAQLDEVTCRWAGIDDAGQVVPAEWFEDVVGWAIEALRDPSAKLLAHCHMGINWGPTAGYAVLLGQGWEPIEAITAIRRARPIAYVAYAEDALGWHHWRTGASEEGAATTGDDLPSGAAGTLSK